MFRQITNYTYDDTGQMLTMQDPNKNTTGYSYADNYASGSPPGPTNAYVTVLTDALGHTQKSSYNYADGQLGSSTDQNQQTTLYSYGGNGDLLDRLTEINYPDGGETCFTYNDGEYAVGVNPPTPSVTTAKILTSGQTCASAGAVQSISAIDGVGHPTQTQLSSDPSGNDYTLATYDGSGRKYQEWNPTRCSLNTTSPPSSCNNEPSFGKTTYSYDALGRNADVSGTPAITRPDGNTVGIVYTGNCAMATDEQGKARKTCTDGLGRLTQVYEDPKGLGYLTTYTYDALDNLLSVNQGGQLRTFNYDSLSRLTSATHPEWTPTGGSSPCSVTYAYDANGNLTSRTAPQPNQLSCSTTVTTTNAYDALNRLTQKNYSDGTPPVNFAYDRNNAWLNNTNVPIVTASDA